MVCGSCSDSNSPATCWQPVRAAQCLFVAQNAAGQIFDQETVRRKAQPRCRVTVPLSDSVTRSAESPILDVECRPHGEYAGDMTI